jgi:integrase
MLQEYVIYILGEFSARSAQGIFAVLRQLYRFLEMAGYTGENYSLTLSPAVPVEKKIKPPVPQEEIEAMLCSINTDTAIGKRDYAMLLLGVMTGLRSIDVVRLRLSDILWENGEIRINQSKTNRSLCLPLTKNVGEAFKNYILNGRPETDAPELFVRHNAPHVGFSGSSIVGSIYKDCLVRSGFDSRTGRGTFHGLRRSLGLNMVVSGIPVTTVAQVLGHSGINATRPYIDLDSKHLKECALDFRGIEVAKNEL